MPFGFLRTHSSTGASVLSVLIVLALAALSRPGVAATTDTTSPQYERPDARTIQTCIREILDDPQFAPRKSFGQWLREKLSKWDGPKVDLPEGVGMFLLWAVTVWCVLALLAILVHLGWTIWLFARRPKGPGTAAGSDGSTVYEHLSFEQLRQKSRELARAGAFREAAGVLLIALLRRLEAFNVLRFHSSKTNGEYLREYSGELAGRPQFVQFIATFERSIYGGLEIPMQTYETMNSLAERILNDVGQKPQI